MEQFHFLNDIFIVYAASAVVVYLFHKIGQSAVIGFLVAGILIGPNGIGLIADRAAVHELAEIGVMLLLFSIGLEFSPQKLKGIRRTLLITGPIQVLATVGLTSLLCSLAGLPLSESVAIGFVVALSSTAMVVKILMDRGELESLHGRVCLGILIFQDLAVVPMIVLLPHLGPGDESWGSIALSVAMAFALLAAIFFGARYLFPRVMRRVALLGNKELFIVTVIISFLAIAWVSSMAGFSLALGGFLAGLVLSASEYSHQIFSEIRPLRDMLNSLFFVSIGMLVNPALLGPHLTLVIVAISVIVLGKALLVSVAALASGVPFVTALVSGMTLAQIGEFSFVLLEESWRMNLIPNPWYQVLIFSAVATMISAPFLTALSRRLAGLAVVQSLSRRRLKVATEAGATAETSKAKDHVIVCGFGISGQNIVRALQANRMGFTVIDLNPTVEISEDCRPGTLILGDCTDPEMLLYAGIKEARVIVVAISDPFAARRAVRTARSLNPEILVLVRTKRVRDIDELYEAGADEVVPEEFEASIELLTRILRFFNFPREAIAEEVRGIRQDRYQLFRKGKSTIPRLRLSSEVDVFTETVPILMGSPFDGARIDQTDLRRRSGALILGLIREKAATTNPPAGTVLQAGDLVVLSGSKEQLREAIEMIKGAGSSL